MQKKQYNFQIKKFKHKKNLGQNFLNDKNIIEKILVLSQPKDKNILEIGLGKGALTKYLIVESNFFLGFEIDKELHSYFLNYTKNKKKKYFSKIFFLYKKKK